jgi:hypothetical protein
MSDQTMLYSKLEEIKAKLEEKEWRYYYLTSVENFIYHLSNFKNERTREKVSSDIEKYLEIVVEKIDEETTSEKKAKKLFPYIWKIANIYKLELGFIKKPSWFTFSVLSITLFFLMRISFAIAESLLICVAVFTLYSAYVFLKIKTRKVF